MAEIVNLRRARKAAARSAERRRADASAARHGETAAQRKARRSEEARAAKLLDGARRDAGPDATAEEAAAAAEPGDGD